MLKILVQNRPDARTRPGGDTVQMDWTVKCLREAGHFVDVSLAHRPALAEYAVVHLFNLTRPIDTFIQARHAQDQGKPYTLSSVYWNLDSAIPWRAYVFPARWWRRLPEGLRGAITRRRFTARAERQIGAKLEAGWQRPEDLQREVVLGAQCIFPNSCAEMEHLRRQFGGVPDERFLVVLNGVAVDQPGEPQISAADRRPFLCAGAIGPRKNQLNLVKAFRLLPNERLRIVGDVAQGCERYRRAVRAASGANVEFVGAVPREAMMNIYAGARALVQPSYIETPGLAAMEAVALGLPVVVADVEPVREYFAELAHYCAPDSPTSIAVACRAAAAAEPIDGADFRERYSWRRVLRPLVDYYTRWASRTKGKPAD